MRKEGGKPSLPDNPARYLTDWLFSVGPSLATGQGQIEIGWDTIRDWSRLTGVHLLPWEAETLRSLSRAYVGQWYAARKPECPPPFISKRREDVDAARARVERQFAALAGLAKKGAVDEPDQAP